MKRTNTNGITIHSFRFFFCFIRNATAFTELIVRIFNLGTACLINRSCVMLYPKHANDRKFRAVRPMETQQQEQRKISNKVTSTATEYAYETKAIIFQHTSKHVFLPLFGRPFVGVARNILMNWLRNEYRISVYVCDLYIDWWRCMIFVAWLWPWTIKLKFKPDEKSTKITRPSSRNGGHNGPYAFAFA